MIRSIAGIVLLFITGPSLFAQSATPARAPRVLPDNVELRPVTIWSDGTRMVGDLYLPKEIKEGQRLPAIVLCAGTGGTKITTGTKLGPILAQAGYVTLAFDYRGWGQSDSKLMLLEPMPKPDAKGEVNVHARAVRWQLDFADQVADIRAAIAFVAGEKAVDPQRIGIWGTSYGGGLVTWTAGNDPRVKCMAVQVPGMGAKPPAAIKYAYDLLTKQARGEVEPVPYETGKMTGKMSTYDMMRINPAKAIGYSAFDAAAKITAPSIILVAEKEELMDNAENGQKVYDIINAKGVPAKLHVLPNITHYGVYKEAFDEATKLELDWFNQYLRKDAK